MQEKIKSILVKWRLKLLTWFWGSQFGKWCFKRSMAIFGFKQPIRLKALLAEIEAASASGETQEAFDYAIATGRMEKLNKLLATINSRVHQRLH